VTSRPLLIPPGRMIKDDFGPYCPQPRRTRLARNATDCRADRLVEEVACLEPRRRGSSSRSRRRAERCERCIRRGCPGSGETRPPSIGVVGGLLVAPLDLGRHLPAASPQDRGRTHVAAVPDHLERPRLLALTLRYSAEDTAVACLRANLITSRGSGASGDVMAVGRRSSCDRLISSPTWLEIAHTPDAPGGGAMRCVHLQLPASRSRGALRFSAGARSRIAPSRRCSMRAGADGKCRRNRSP
jgi:hypothetical protein